MDKEMLMLHTEQARLDTKSNFMSEQLKMQGDALDKVEVKVGAIQSKLDKIQWLLYAIAAGVASQIPGLSYIKNLF